jgi:hypothetical protein
MPLTAASHSHADDSVFAERMLMPVCAYPYMMIMINEVWLPGRPKGMTCAPA